MHTHDIASGKTAKKKKLPFSGRHLIQTLASAGTNAHIAGFIHGDIFKGASKSVCVPGLNCYSCPGAIGSCPVGAFQAVAGSKKYNFAFYVTGMGMLFGAVFGRFICGFLCPFGFFQDLLHKIKAKRIKVPEKTDTVLRFTKYIILAIFVILLPAFAVNAFGIAPPYFCKLVCPAGIFGGALPLIIKNESLRTMLGFLFGWKSFFLALTVVFSVFIYRPFCKYICPLGAFYAFFNKIALYRMRIDTAKCTRCGACQRKCPMQVKIISPIKGGAKEEQTPRFFDVTSPECIRCQVCKSVCPHSAIDFGFVEKKAPCRDAVKTNSTL